MSGAFGRIDDNEHRPVRTRPKWRRTVILCVAVLVAAGVGFVAGYLPIRTFDAGMWRDGEKSGTTVRLHMIEFLVRSGRLDGLTRSQIVSLLGPSTRGNYFADWDYVYWLGPERGLLRMDSEWLVLRIGPDGRVSDYRVVTD